MKTATGTLAAALLVALTTSAIAAGAASADEWFVVGTKLAAGKSAAFATASSVNAFSILRWTAGSEELAIECGGVNLVGGEAYISGGAGGMAKSLTFEKCKIIVPKIGCELAEQPANLNTPPLGLTTSLLAGSSGPTKIGINLHPLTKKTFLAFQISESSTCFGHGGGTITITGSVLFLSSDGATESVTHQIVAQGSSESNGLEFAGVKVILEGGSELLKLASGSKWSFHA
jgi:hypothetical protein